MKPSKYKIHRLNTFPNEWLDVNYCKLATAQLAFFVYLTLFLAKVAGQLQLTR